MSKIIAQFLSDKNQFALDAIEALTKQNQTFCQGVGELAKIR